MMDLEFPNHIEAPIKEKLCKIVTTVTENLPERPEEVFVSTMAGQGTTDYVGVWLFTPKLVVEIRNPLSQRRIQYEIARLKDSVDWIRLDAHDYEFKEPSESSRLDLEFTTKDGLSKVLSANGEGCRYLMKIYRTRFLSNFTGTREAT